LYETATAGDARDIMHEPGEYAEAARIQRGAFMAKASRPTRTAEPPRLRTSQGSATDCIQVPMFDRRLEIQKTA